MNEWIIILMQKASIVLKLEDFVKLFKRYLFKGNIKYTRMRDKARNERRTSSNLPNITFTWLNSNILFSFN